MNGQPRPQSTFRGILLLLGFFFVLCASFALVVTFIDVWTVTKYSHWPTAQAVVDEAFVTSEKPFAKYGNSPIITLNCRLHFDAGARPIETTLLPASTRGSDPERVAIMNDWVNAHPRGSGVAIRYDPERPSRAVLRDFPAGLIPPEHPKEDVVIVGGFGAAAVLAIAIGRKN